MLSVNDLGNEGVKLQSRTKNGVSAKQSSRRKGDTAPYPGHFLSPNIMQEGGKQSSSEARLLHKYLHAPLSSFPENVPYLKVNIHTILIVGF